MTSQGPEITIIFRPELRDLLHAARVWEANHWKIANRVVATVLLAWGGFLLYMTSYAWGIIFLFVGILELFNLLPAAAIRAFIEFRANPKFREEYQLTIADERLLFRTATIDSTLKWTHYTDYYETSKAFILVYGKRMYTVIPKRALANNDQLEYLRSLLARVIPRQ
jgi:hypothetical protein